MMARGCGHREPISNNRSAKEWSNERVDNRPDGSSDPAPAVRRRDGEDSRGLQARLEPGGPGRASGGCPERAPRPDRRRRLREPEYLRRPDRHAELHAHGGGGAPLQPLPRDRGVLPDPGGDAHGPQPAPRRLRPRRGVLRALPGLQRHHSARLRDAAADPAGERLHDLLHRQVASDPGRPAGLERALQPLAVRARVRLLLGLPGRRGGPVRPPHHREPEGSGRSRGHRRQAVLLPGRHAGEGDRLATPRARGTARCAVVHVLRDRVQPCAAPRAAGVVGQVQGEVRPGLGRRCERRRWRARRSSASCLPRRSCRRTTPSRNGTP